MRFSSLTFRYTTNFGIDYWLIIKIFIIDAIIGERRSEMMSLVRLWTLHVVSSRSAETFDSFCWFVSVTFRRSSLVPRIICLHLDRHFFSFVPSAWNKTLRHLILLTTTIWYCMCKALIVSVERCPVHWTFLLIRVIDLAAYRSFDFAVSFEEYAIRRYSIREKCLITHIEWHFLFLYILFIHFLRAAKFIL